MNKIISNFPVTLTYIRNVILFTLLAITFTGTFTNPYFWIFAKNVFIAEHEIITAFLSSGLVVSLILDAGIYAGRWLDNNEEAFHVKFKIMKYEYLKKIIEEQKKEDSHDNK